MCDQKHFVSNPSSTHLYRPFGSFTLTFWTRIVCILSAPLSQLLDTTFRQKASDNSFSKRNSRSPDLVTSRKGILPKVSVNTADADLNMKVDVGGGYRSKDGFLRLDIDVELGPDVVADAHYLPFRNNTINEIYCSHVLEHLQNPRLAVKEIARVLKSRAVATIIVPNMRLPWAIYLSYNYGDKRSPFEAHEWKITRTALERLTRNSDLVTSELQPLNDHETHWGIEWFFFATKLKLLTESILFAKSKIKWLDKLIGTLNRSCYRCLNNSPELKIQAIKIIDRS